MKLDDKIRNRKIAYLIKKEPTIAFELALLYFISAKRKNTPRKIIDACSRSIYWLKKAGVKVPDYLRQLNPFKQLEALEETLVYLRP